MEKFSIIADNLYNWDEKGFLLGTASSSKRLMTLEALESGRITHASQDGSREFISLLACIGADGVTLPPALIYKGDSGTLQDTWVEDWKPENPAYFAVSPNGWSCGALGLDWLTKVFHRCTEKKAGNRRRLLIVDGHSSHVNMRFINQCDRLRILLLILPPHSTHRLQPLDVSLFSPLATFYSNGLTQMLTNSLGYLAMSKRAFWSVFWPAWKLAFTPKNIASGYAKTGIFPYNPSLVLDIITKPQPIEPYMASGSPKTPMTGRAVRRLQKAYKKAPSEPLVAKLFKANERLAAENSIGTHMILGLTAALIEEKRRRKRGKRLNLLGEEEPGPQFFSPGRVTAARAWQAEKEEEEQQHRQDIESRKALAASKKLQKEDEKLQKAAAAIKKQRLAAEAKTAKAAEIQARKELREEAKRYKKGLLELQKRSTGSCKIQKTPRKQAKQPRSPVTAKEEGVVVLATSRGRKVQLPRRFAI